MSSIPQEVAESPLEKILWFANEANSVDYRSAAELEIELGSAIDFPATLWRAS